MKKSFLILVGGILVVGLTACNLGRIEKDASGEVVSRTTQLDDVNTISMKDIFVNLNKKSSLTKINIHYSEEERIEIKTNESLFEDLKVKTGSSKATISASKTTCYNVEAFSIDVYCNSITEIDLSYALLDCEEKVLGSELKVELSGACIANVELPSLSSLQLDLSGASEFKSSTTASIEKIQIAGSGASTINIAGIFATMVNTHLSGASKATISGTTNSVELSLSGASKFDGSSLNGSTAKVGLSGASSAVVNVIQNLEYSISGASSLKYVSQPVTIDGSSSGGSSVNKQ